MSNIKIFENEQFGKIRSLVKDGQIWFIGKDICDALGYANSRKAIADHVKENHRNSVTIRDGIGNPQKTIIDEAGLYSLVMRSKTDAAERFQEWVTAEVLPSIRKTGSYSVKSKRMTKAQRERLDNATKAERRRTAELWHKFGEMASNQTYKDICVCYGTAELAGKEVLALPEATEKTYTATEIGRMLGVSANKIGKLANMYGLKTEEYGKLFYDKAAHSHKQVETFRYYEKAIAKFRELLEAA